MRPNLGYSNYHWINVERREREAMILEREDLSEAELIPNSEINLSGLDKDVVEFEEDEYTDFSDVTSEKNDSTASVVTVNYQKPYVKLSDGITKEAGKDIIKMLEEREVLYKA